MSGVPTGGGRIAARFVALDAERLLADAELVWDRRGRLVSVRRARGKVADLCVLPGLVNAHAHLQIAPLATPQPGFVPWLGAVMAARAGASPPAAATRLRAAIAELLAGGATAVGEIDSLGSSVAALAKSPLRARVYRELTGFHLDAAGARALLRARRPDRTRRAAAIASGLSPHAPYSCSAALFTAAAAASRHLAIHCAEVPEEQHFLRQGRGPFRDLLQRLGRLPADFRPPGVGAVRWLASLGVLRTGTQLVHCQELERGDVPLLAGTGASLVVCPGTIEHFGRQPPPVPRWLQGGLTVALGTDSRASNTGLSMREELRRAALFWPSLSPAQLLAMATGHGARSLGLPGAGRLRRGARADFVVVPAAATFAASLAAFVHGASPLLRVVCGGRTFEPPPPRPGR